MMSAPIDIAIGDQLPLCEYHAKIGSITRTENGWWSTLHGPPPGTGRLKRLWHILKSPTCDGFFWGVYNCPNCPDFALIIHRAPGPRFGNPHLR